MGGNQVAVIVPDVNSVNQVVFLVILIIVILQLRERKVRLGGLLILPILMSYLTVIVVSSVIFSSVLNFSLIILGLIIGFLIGIAIGSLMKVKVDEEGRMLLKGSFVAVILWIIIILLKVYGQDFIIGAKLIDVNVVTSIFLMMALGAVISRRVIIYRKYLQIKKDIKKEESEHIS